MKIFFRAGASAGEEKNDEYGRIADACCYTGEQREYTDTGCSYRT
jgi:hypothetical protein